MANIGVRAHDFGRMEPEALAMTLSKAGFTTSQLALTKAITGVESLADVDSSLLKRIKEAFNKHSVEIGVLGCYMEIGLPDKEARLSEVDKFLTGLSYANAIGAKLTGTETTNFKTSSMEGTLSREQTYQNLKDSVLRMTERAEELGVDIGIEPVADHTLNSAELTKRLIDEVNSKRLHLIFDPVNMILTQSDIERQEEIYQEFTDMLGDNILALHVKDIVMENDIKIWSAIGKGDIRYTKIADWLHLTGRSIPILREEIKPDSAALDRQAMMEFFGFS